MPYKDPEVRKAYGKKYNLENRPLIRKTIRLRRDKKKLKAIEYTGGKPCHNPKCEHNPKYLHHVDFHHVIVENKTKNFARLFEHHTWHVIKREIDDCKAIPLCTMCHRDIEYNTAPQPLYRQEGLD